MSDSPAQILELLRSGEAPAELKGSLARAIFPLGPAPLIESLIILASDRDRGIKEEAIKSLRKLPMSMVLGVSSSVDSPPALLQSLSRLFAKNAEVLEKILLNGSAEDDTVAYIASLPFPPLLEIVGRQHGRLERSPSILEALRENKETPAHILSLVEETEHRRRAQEAPARPVHEVEPMEEEEVAVIPGGHSALIEEEPALETAGGEGKAAVEQKKLSIIMMLKELSAGQKVALAMKGNSEVRKHLIREKNRLISEKVLENPRITDSELESFAKSTNVSEDVLRTIGKKREWVSQPGILRSLVTNPRTPVALSMGLLKRLSVKELEGLSKNRNVPEALRNMARKWYKQKVQTQR